MLTGTLTRNPDTVLICIKLIQAGYNLNWLKYSQLNEQIAQTVKLLYSVNPKHTVADKRIADK